MAGRTVSAHLDDDLAKRLSDVARAENRPVSQVLAVALKSFVGLAPGSRQSLFVIDGECSQAEREFVDRYLSRQVLRAHRAVIENRYMAANRERALAGSNAEPETELDIEAEATRACPAM